MKRREEAVPSRGKIVLTGTLAMFAMGSVSAAEMPKALDKNEPVPDSGKAPDASAEGQSRPSQIVHKYNIPAGSLADVVTALQRETSLKITLPDRFASLPSKGVTGVLTTEEALTAALNGTHLSADFNAPNEVLLDLHDASQSVTVTTHQEPTSLKYTAPLRDLPQTLTIIPQEVLQTTASTSLVEALRTVPGIAFGAGEGGNPIGDRPYIRGVDSQSSTFVDGVRDIGSQSREVFDLENIEVSKGPSGSFAGRSASGGSINLNSKLARRENFITGTYSPGSANFFRGTVDANLKLANWGAFRLNGMGQDNETAGRDVVQAQRYGVAPSLLLNVSNKGRLAFNYYDLNSYDIPDPGIPYNNPANYYTGTVGPRPDGRAQVFQPGDGQPLLIKHNLFYGLRSRDFRNEKVRTAFGRAEYNLTERTVLRNSYRYGTSRQDYLYSQSDDSQGNILYGLVYRRQLNRNTFVDTSINQTDFSGQVKTGAVEHSFAAGGEFSRERSWNNSYTLALPANIAAINPTTRRQQFYSISRCPTGAGAASAYFCTDLFNPNTDDPFYSATTRLNQQVGTTQNAATANYTPTLVKNNNPTRQVTGTMSAYGFDTFRVSKLQVTAGVRYDHYNANYRNALTCVPTAAVPCTFQNVTGLVTYQGAVAYKPVQSATIYGSVSSSATPPGNSLSQGSDPSGLTSIVNQALPPEKTRSEEAGVKWELFHGKALATGAFFYANTDNVRITLADNSIGAVGSRRNRGLDFGITGYVTRKLQVFGGYTFMNAILTNAGGAAGAAGLIDGRRYPNTPANSFSVTSYYAVTRKLSLGGGIYGVGKVFGNDSPTAPKWVPSYVRGDVYGSYRFSPHVELAGNLLNVGNTTYYLQAYTTHYATLAPGRQGRLSFNFRY